MTVSLPYVTLLVLEIKVPYIAAHDSLSELAGVLWELAPKFVSWVISFVTVCVIWLNLWVAKSP